MKKIIGVLLSVALLCGCAQDASLEDLSAGVRKSNKDIAEFQPIRLVEARDSQGTSQKHVKCENDYDAFFSVDNTTWGVAKYNSQEVYLLKIARSVWKSKATGEYTYAICYKQKLF